MMTEDHKFEDLGEYPIVQKKSTGALDKVLMQLLIKLRKEVASSK
jgi:hypothetical protein